LKCRLSPFSLNGNNRNLRQGWEGKISVNCNSPKKKFQQESRPLRTLTQGKSGRILKIEEEIKRKGEPNGKGSKKKEENKEGGAGCPFFPGGGVEKEQGTWSAKESPIVVTRERLERGYIETRGKKHENTGCLGESIWNTGTKTVLRTRSFIV